MAFPTTITTGGDVAVGCGGPFLSSGGNVYVIVRDDVTTSKFRAFKATDPTSSFSNVGTDPQVTSAQTIKAFAAVQDGDNIHVITHDNASATTNQIRYHIFSMSSDSWTTTNEAVKGTSFSTVTISEMYISIKLRSTGDVIVLYVGPRVANMGSDRERVYYARRVSGTWTVDVAVDNGGATNWYSGDIVVGSSDRMHLFLHDNGVGDGYQRCLRSNNVLETFPASFDTTIHGHAGTLSHRGASYVSGANTKVRHPYVESTANDESSAKCDSADTPTMSTDVDISGAEPTFTVRGYSFAADGTTLWNAFIQNTNTDIYTQSNADDAGWSTPVSFYAGTVTQIYTSVYTRGSDIVLAMVFGETDPKYHEKVLLAGDTFITQCEFEEDFGRYRRR